MRRHLMLAALTTIILSTQAAQSQTPEIRDLNDALKYLKSDKSTDRAFALSVMGLLKDDARSASREIVQAYFDSDKDVRVAADLALKGANPTLYQPVTDLVNGAYEKRVDAVDALAKLGKDAAAAAPALINFMKDAQPAERGTIIRALTSIAPNDKTLAPLMVQWAIKDQSADVRKAAMKALPALADAGDQVTAITDLINNNENSALDRERAVQVLAVFGPGNPDVVKTLQTLQTNPTPQVRDAAKMALEEIKKKK
jgi:HEAT repeat protein